MGEIEFVPGERFEAEVHYYSYGVVCLRLERYVDLEWQALIELCARWVAAPVVEAAAAEEVRRQLAAVGAALVKPYDPHLSEDYAIIRLDPLTGSDGMVTAEELLERFGGKIAQTVRGEFTPLAAEEQAYILASRLSYYPADVIVAGWNAALVYDTAAGAEATVQVIEYANTQLLEFRFYDEQLTGTLAEVSDMFAARLYSLVSVKVGVPDYRRLVDSKLKTAGELYSFMTQRLNHSNTLILETLVVIILITDLGRRPKLC